MARQEYYVACDAAGEVVGAGSCDAADFVKQLPLHEGGAHVKVDAGTAALVASDRARWRVAGGAVVERDAMAAALSKAAIAADGADTALVTGFPAGARATIEGPMLPAPVVIDHLSGDEPIEIASTEPGRITVRLEKNPTHKPWTAAVDAQA